MSDCDNTCKQKEKVSVTEDTGSLKRSIQDDDNIEEDASNKRAKTTERADEVAENKKAFVPKKKKCALLLSYCGAGYNGMQINPGVRTIEDELINALYKAEAITEDGKANLGKVGFGAHLIQYEYYLIAQHVIRYVDYEICQTKEQESCSSYCTGLRIMATSL